MYTKIIQTITLTLVAVVAISALISAPMALAAGYNDSSYMNELLYDKGTGERPWSSNVIGEATGLSSGDSTSESGDLVKNFRTILDTFIIALASLAVLVSIARFSTRGVMELMKVDNIPPIFLTASERGSKGKINHEKWVSSMLTETFIFLAVTFGAFLIIGTVIGIAIYVAHSLQDSSNLVS